MIVRIYFILILLAISFGSYSQSQLNFFSIVVADFDGDGRVGFSDFVLFAQGFGSTDARFDLNGDGVVSFPDFLIFGSLFQSGG